MDEGQPPHGPAFLGTWSSLWRGIRRRGLAIDREHRSSLVPPAALSEPSQDVARLSEDGTFRPDAADIVVRALGGTDVWVKGTPIETWATQRGLMVLRYLVLNAGKPAGKETLMDILWPHSSVNAARNNLNVAIYGLRRSLEAGGKGPYIVYRDGAYSLSCLLSLETDVAEFEAQVRSGDQFYAEGEADAANQCYVRAMDLYRGPLFDDDTTGDWYLMVRRSLQDRHIHAIERVADQALRRGDAGRCIELAHEVVRIDPCRETAHRLLMRAYAGIDQYQLAARQYADCVAALQDELAVAPHPETTAAFRALFSRS